MDSWNKLSNSLLEKNHIKIPIEKRFFLSFIEDDETNINKYFRAILVTLFFKN